MRINLTIALLVTTLLQVSASGYAQKVTLSKSNASLMEVFREIRKQTGFDFIYSAPPDKLKGRIDIQVEGVSLQEVLEKCLRGQSLTYEINNKDIIIKASALVIQDRRISGKVSSKSTGSPLSGVTVGVKGSSLATQTDKLGQFTLTLPEQAQSLIVRFIGFQVREIPLTSAAVYNIQLEEEQVQLNNVVVTGLFERPEGNFTGATRSISGEELKRVSSNNVFLAITALDPAIRLIPNNITGGNINELPDIQVRGSNSLPNLSGELSNNPNAPLFILDGFEVTLRRIADLDMNLIKSITILKDASATSIYGSRGANGVLVITSIAPRPGKIRITFTNDFRLTTPDLSDYNLLSSAEKLDFELRAGVYKTAQANQQFERDQAYAARATAVVAGVETDWLSKPLQYGYSDRSSLFLEGGDEYIRYGVQLSGDFQKGVMIGQGRNNYSGQFDLTYILKKLKFQNSIRLYQNLSHESKYGSFSNYVRQNPYWTPYAADGSITKVLENSVMGVFANPLYNATLNTFDKSQIFGISNNFQLRYTIFPSLFIESSFSLNKSNASRDQFYPAQHSMFVNERNVKKQGSYSVRNTNSLGYETLTTANFNKLFGKHQVFSTVGFNAASISDNYYSIAAEGFPFDRLDNLLFATQYVENSRPTGDESTIHRLGYLFNANYSYDNRYLTDLSFRRDGSSQFGADKRYGTFWSVGLGWNLHNESFLKESKVFNRLKLRGSYGSSGSLNIPAYRAQTRYNFSVDNIYDGQLGTAILGLGNSELGWQDVRTLDLGLDMVVFKDRLDLRFDYYRGITKNTITTISLAPSTGFTGYSENLGKVQNTGLEISARYKLINDQQNGIFWSVNASAFTNKNILKEMSNKLKATNARTDASNVAQVVPNILLQEGQAINTIYAVPSLGVDPITGEEVFLKKNGQKTFVWNAADKVALGATDPDWNGTFGTTASYKGLDLNLIFSYRLGAQVYNQTLIDKVESVNPYYNVDRRAYDLGWTKPGDQSLYTKIVVNKVPTKLTSRFVQNEDLLNLSSASLSYNFYRHTFLKKMGLGSLQLTAITNDLFRVSTVRIERGISNPFARTYSLSLRAGF